MTPPFSLPVDGGQQDMADRIAKAKAAGYSDDQIQQALSQGPSFAQYVNAGAERIPEQPLHDIPPLREPAYGFTDAAAHGMTAGANEKALAAVEAAIRSVRGGGSFEDEYDRALAARMAARQQYLDAHGLLNTAGEMAGTGMVAGEVAKLLPAAATTGKLARTLTGAGSAVVMGAAKRAGEAQPGQEWAAATDPGAAEFDAALGGIGGLVVPPALEALANKFNAKRGARAALANLPQIRGEEERLAQAADAAASQGKPATMVGVVGGGAPEANRALLGGAAGGSPESFDATKEFIRERAGAAGPLYEASMTQPGVPVPTDITDLQRIAASIDRMPPAQQREAVTFLATADRMPADVRAATIARLTAQTPAPTPGFAHMNRTAEIINEPPSTMGRLLGGFNSQFAAPEPSAPALGGAPPWLGNPIAAQDAAAAGRQATREAIRAANAPVPEPPPPPPPSYRATPPGRAAVPTPPSDRMVPLTPEIRAAMADPMVARQLARRGFAIPEEPQITGGPPGEREYQAAAKRVAGALSGSPTTAELARSIPPSLLAKNPHLAAAIGANRTAVPLRVLQQLNEDIGPLLHGPNIANTADIAAAQEAMGTIMGAADEAVPAYSLARATAAPYKQFGVTVGRDGTIKPQPGGAFESAQLEQQRQALPGGKNDAAPRPYEVASTMMGHGWGPTEYAIRQAVKTNPRIAPELMKLLLTGSEGAFAGQPLGNAKDLADLLRGLAAVRTQQLISPVVVGTQAGAR